MANRIVDALEIIQVEIEEDGKNSAAYSPKK